MFDQARIDDQTVIQAGSWAPCLAGAEVLLDDQVINAPVLMPLGVGLSMRGAANGRLRARGQGTCSGRPRPRAGALVVVGQISARCVGFSSAG